MKPGAFHRACLGIIRLAKRYGKDRVEAASLRALATGAVRYMRIPAQTGHLFRSIPATYSETNRPPIPGLIGHFF